MTENDNAPPNPQDAAVERIDRAIRSCCDRVKMRLQLTGTADNRNSGGHRVGLEYETARARYSVEVLRNGHWTLACHSQGHEATLAEGGASRTEDCARSLVLHHLDLALQFHLNQRGPT